MFLLGFLLYTTLPPDFSIPVVPFMIQISGTGSRHAIFFTEHYPAFFPYIVSLNNIQYHFWFSRFTVVSFASLTLLRCNAFFNAHSTYLLYPSITQKYRECYMSNRVILATA